MGLHLASNHYCSRHNTNHCWEALRLKQQAHEFNQDDIIGGIVLIIIGSLLLFSNLYGFNFWTVLFTYWPLVFVIIGAYLILKNWRGFNGK